jgi:hypothetical protein
MFLEINVVILKCYSMLNVILLNILSSLNNVMLNMHYPLTALPASYFVFFSFNNVTARSHVLGVRGVGLVSGLYFTARDTWFGLTADHSKRLPSESNGKLLMYIAYKSRNSRKGWITRNC